MWCPCRARRSSSGCECAGRSTSSAKSTTSAASALWWAPPGICVLMYLPEMKLAWAPLCCWWSSCTALIHAQSSAMCSSNSYRSPVKAMALNEEGLRSGCAACTSCDRSLRVPSSGCRTEADRRRGHRGRGSGARQGQVRHRQVHTSPGAVPARQVGCTALLCVPSGAAHDGFRKACGCAVHIGHCVPVACN